MNRDQTLIVVVLLALWWMTRKQQQERPLTPSVTTDESYTLPDGQTIPGPGSPDNIPDYDYDPDEYGYE